MREMKYSGVEWMEDIPASWNMIRFKDKYQSIKEIAGESSSEYERLALTLGGVIKRPKDDSEGLQPKAFDGYQILRENDFVFKMIDLQNVSTSRVGLSPYTGLVSPAYIRFCSKNKNQFNKFVYYYLMSMYYNCVFNSLGGDGVRSALNASDMGMLMIPFPSEHEQMLIVEAIESQTDKVDALIANQEAQIVKLKAYKQSLITEVVTKGLDPNVPMKDSGVDEIGCIPENYDIRKTLLCLDMPITDGPHTTPELFDEGIPFVSAEAVSCGNGGIDFSHIRGYISQEFYEECCKKYIPQIDDIYMIKSGATTGRVSIVSTDEVFTIWSPLAVFRCNSEVVVPKYLFYYLQSKCYQQQVELGWSYGTQQNIGMRTLEKLKVVVPPLDIQNRIIEYLDHQFEKTNELISIKQLKIEKLNQYKKSLIYEYVTGKKEVSC